MARNCRKPPRKRKGSDTSGMSGNELRRTEPPDRHLYSTGCTDPERCDYVVLELDVSQGRQLYFLVDSGADISLVKSEKLLGTAEFEPKDRVRVKSVDGLTIETQSRLETQVL
jgi:hypothetical protein